MNISVGSGVTRGGVAVIAVCLAGAMVVGGFGCSRASDDPLVALRSTVRAPATVRVGNEVEFLLVLRNTAFRSVTLPVGTGGYRFDVIVRGRGGVLVWRRLATEDQQPVKQYILEHDQGVVLQAGWGLRDAGGRPLPPGEYSVEGLLVAPDSRSAAAEQILTMRVLP